MNAPNKDAPGNSAFDLELDLHPERLDPYPLEWLQAIRRDGGKITISQIAHEAAWLPMNTKETHLAIGLVMPFGKVIWVQAEYRMDVGNEKVYALNKDEAQKEWEKILSISISKGLRAPTSEDFLPGEQPQAKIKKKRWSLINVPMITCVLVFILFTGILILGSMYEVYNSSILATDAHFREIMRNANIPADPKSLVSKWDEVEEGQILARITDSGKVEDLRLLNERIEFAKGRKGAIPTDLEYLNAQLKSQIAAANAAKEKYDAVAKVAQKGYYAPAALTDLKLNYEEKNSRVQETHRLILAANSEKSTLDKTWENDFKAAKNQRAILEEQLRNSVLKSPCKCWVRDIPLSVGEHLQFILVPKDAVPYVEAVLPKNVVSGLTIGERIRFTLGKNEDYEYGIFEGVIPQDKKLERVGLPYSAWDVLDQQVVRIDPERRIPLNIQQISSQPVTVLAPKYAWLNIQIRGYWAALMGWFH